MAKKETLQKMRFESRKEYEHQLGLCEQQRMDELFRAGCLRRERDTVSLKTA
jgi:hypothetical protein